MHQERERIYADPGLSAVFVNPRTGKIWNEVYVCMYVYKDLCCTHVILSSGVIYHFVYTW